MDSDSTLCIQAELKNLSAIRRFVEEMASALGAGQDMVADVILAADEAATNIIVHGYQYQPGTIEIELDRSGDAIVIYMRDQSPPFDPTSVPTPDVTQPLDERPLGGMGIHLMRQLMDQVTYRSLPQGGNELTMTKKGVT